MNPSKKTVSEYKRWCERADESLKPELLTLAGNAEALEDAFFRDLEFGTGGLRGIVGVGTNRMNVYTVARATQGLADWLKKDFQEPSVAVCRDSRNMSWEFTQVVAEVLAANRIHAWVYSRIEPTPALSFATRYMHCSAGINLTASHNPKEYNGYKVYASDGCQITTETAKAIQAAIEAVDMFDGARRLDWDEALASGYVDFIGENCLDDFLDEVAGQSLEMSPDTKLSVVYTPLNGTGQECVGRILDRIGNIEVTLVSEQSYANGNFPTCPYPNPEILEALEHGLALCERIKPDLLLATDPDCDRAGIAVHHEDSYELLTGNEVGILLTDYVAQAKRAAGDDLTNSVVITTIVSSDMVNALAEEYGFQVRRTLTGFKFIGEQIGLFEAAGQAKRFIFGFEESYGYLRGAYVRDKDAVVASMLICQMARFHKSRGCDLVEAMEELYRKYGYYRNSLISMDYPGAEGAQRMAAIMARLRSKPPVEIAGLTVKQVIDYLSGLTMPVVNSSKEDEVRMLPPSNVLEFRLDGGSKLIVRPSGTEPKVKVYLFAKETTSDAANALIEKLDTAVRALLTADLKVDFSVPSPSDVSHDMTLLKESECNPAEGGR